MKSRKHLSPVSLLSPRVAAVGALAGTAVLLLAGPAAAHVTVQPEEVEQGGYSKIVFKVPNERDNAGTTKIEVSLPADHPLASVSTQPVPGWKAEVTRSKLAKPLEVHGEQVTEAVTKITWSGGTIKPGEFQEFPVSVGPLPEDTDRLVFKALQTYQGGEVVRWIEEPKEGEAEPDTPAPVLKLVKGEDDGHGDAAEPTDSAAEEASDGAEDNGGSEQAADSGSDSDSSDGTARALGITGIVVGVVGAGIGVYGMRRRPGGSPSA
ncbi:YcnI family protein [Streptomyces capparidis]